MKPRQCELYRHFDADGVLLYVGIAFATTERLARHKFGSEWFDKIVRIEIERFSTREDAAKAELDAIDAERPLFNKTKRTKYGLAALSDEAKAERAVWIARADVIGLKINRGAALCALMHTVKAVERGDYETAKNSSAWPRFI